MLVAGGAKLDVTDHRGNTPRMLAIQGEDSDLAAYLLSKLVVSVCHKIRIPKDAVFVFYKKSIADA